MQLQQIQVQSQIPTQTQYINESEHQIQNQMIQSQQLTTSQAKASAENRPIMTMVSLGGSNNNTSSPLNAIQTLNSPLSSHLLQPPPNPLAAMTTLSYNPSNAKDDKGAPISNGTSTSSTVTSTPNGSVTIISSSTVSTPTLNSIDKLSGNNCSDLNYKISISICIL